MDKKSAMTSSNDLVITRLNQERKAWRQDHPHVSETKKFHL